MISSKKKFKYWSLVLPYFVFLIAAVFILWTQKNSRAFFVGADSWFHINQFYESAMQIKTGHFSWFLDLFGFGQVGRIVNGLYGPVFSYLVGGLLLLLGSWSRLQIVMSFGVLSISGMLMYHLARYIKLSRSISAILGLLYMSSFPVTTFVNEQTFSGVGDAILPLVILMGIKMWHQSTVPRFLLAGLLAIILQIHLLTCFVAVCALVPFGVVSLWHSSKKFRWLLGLVESIGIFLLLTLNIWGTIIDVFYHNNIIKPFPNHNMVNPEFALVWANGNVSLLNNIFIIIGVVTISLLVINWRRLNLYKRILPAIGIIFLWLSSAYFPWQSIIRVWPMIGQTIQFPKRFLGIGIIILLLVMGQNIGNLGLKSVRNNKVPDVVLLTFLIFLALSSVALEEGVIESHVSDWNSKRVFITTDSTFHPKMRLNRLRRTFNSHNLSLAPRYVIKSVPDYLPSNHRVTFNNYYSNHPYGAAMREIFGYDWVSYRIHRPRGQKAEYWDSVKRRRSAIHFKRHLNKDALMITWRQPKDLNDQTIKIPAVKYNHTVMSLNHHAKSNVRIDKIGVIKIKPHTGINQVSIRYQASRLWSIAMWITVISWLGFVLVMLFTGIKSSYRVIKYNKIER